MYNSKCSSVRLSIRDKRGYIENEIFSVEIEKKSQLIFLVKILNTKEHPINDLYLLRGLSVRLQSYMFMFINKFRDFSSILN